MNKAVSGIVLLVVVGHSHAQEVAPVLEEVLVTAQKRVQNVQDIPVTVNVVSAQHLDKFSIRNTADLADAVPGLTIQPTPQNLAQVAIRRSESTV